MTVKPNRRARRSRHDLFAALRAELRLRGLGTGPWRGSAAEDAVAGIASATETALRSEIRRHETYAVVGLAASMLSMSQDAQFEARIRSHGSLPNARATSFHTENALASRVMLELALREPLQQGDAVDEASTRTLAKLAHQVWRWCLVADRLAYDLCGVDFAELKRDGTFEVRVIDRPPFHISEYERRSIVRMTAHDASDEDDDLNVVRRWMSALDGDELPDELADIDEGLRAARGYGLTAAAAALHFLHQWAGANDAKLAGTRSTRNELWDSATEGIASAYPRIPTTEVDRALVSLVWSQDLLQGTPMQIADYREVPARLYSRPVVELSDTSLFVPRTAPSFALYILGLRLLEGNWPEELTKDDAPLRSALERRRSQARPIQAFEAGLARALGAMGLPHATSIRTSGSKRASPVVNVCLTREIDAVVVTPISHRVWVLEAKDLAIPFSSRRIRSELNKYVRPGGHVDKLREKCDEIAIAPRKVAEALSAPSSENYQVQGVFVTREPTPASCHDDTEFPFVTLDRLVEALHSYIA